MAKLREVLINYIKNTFLITCILKRNKAFFTILLSEWLVIKLLD